MTSVYLEHFGTARRQNRIYRSSVERVNILKNFLFIFKHHAANQTDD